MSFFYKSRDPDSNREPQGYEPCELPIAPSRCNIKDRSKIAQCQANFICGKVVD